MEDGLEDVEELGVFVEGFGGWGNGGGGADCEISGGWGGGEEGEDGYVAIERVREYVL